VRLCSRGLRAPAMSKKGLSNKEIADRIDKARPERIMHIGFVY
jgi:hypothetical protein